MATKIGQEWEAERRMSGRGNGACADKHLKGGAEGVIVD